MASDKPGKKSTEERYIFGIFDIESHKQVINVKFSLINLILGITGVAAGFDHLCCTGIYLYSFAGTDPRISQCENKGSNDEQRTESRFLEKVIHLWEIHLKSPKVADEEDPMTPEEILPKINFRYSRVYGWRKV